MNEPDARITVALMTRNRPHFLREALASVLAQTGVEFDVLVLDNASSDNTPEVVASVRDPRITYLRNETDLGIMRNWNRAIALAVERSPFVSVFHDDDIMLDGFLAESVEGLRRHPSAGLSLCLCQFIRQDGTPLHVIDPGEVKEGMNLGPDFLELFVEGRAIEIPPAIVVFRSDVLRRAAPADSPHTRATMDMHLYYRAASIADVLFVKKVLAQYRLHEGSDTELINRKAGGVFWYGTMAERIDAIAYLLRSPRAADADYRNWLGERLLAAHAHQSTAIHPSIAQMYHTWDNRRAIFLEQLERSLPPGEAFVLVDDGQLALDGEFNGRRVIPFLERDGQYSGRATDAGHAIDELRRMRDAGHARWLVIAWPSFWWLDQYGGFARHLRTSCRLAMDTPHARVFELSGDGRATG